MINHFSYGMCAHYDLHKNDSDNKWVWFYSNVVLIRTVTSLNSSIINCIIIVFILQKLHMSQKPVFSSGSECHYVVYYVTSKLNVSSPI